jgi:hypothetical protein
MKKIFYLTIVLVVMGFGATAQTAMNAARDINITNFTVYAKDTKIMVDWATDGSTTTNTWEVQRSTDGIQFTTIAYVLGADPRKTGDQYTYAEKVKDTKISNAYYRLRHVGADGSEQLSNIIQPVKQ